MSGWSGGNPSMPCVWHQGLLGNAVFSPDGSLIATQGLIDLHVRVWDSEDGHLVADLGEAETSWAALSIHPNGRHLVVVGANGTLRIHTLDSDELVQIARSRVTRGFTADECVAYHIDPCPDLETIQGG